MDPEMADLGATFFAQWLAALDGETPVLLSRQTEEWPIRTEKPASTPSTLGWCTFLSGC